MSQAAEFGFVEAVGKGMTREAVGSVGFLAWRICFAFAFLIYKEIGISSWQMDQSWCCHGQWVGNSKKEKAGKARKC